MRRLDRRRAIAFVDIAGDAACPIDRADMLARLHAQEANSPIVSGAAAFALMWRSIPLLRPLGLIARNAKALRALEWAYLVFLRVRPQLQGLARKWPPRPAGSKQ